MQAAAAPNRTCAEVLSILPVVKHVGNIPKPATMCSHAILSAASHLAAAATRGARTCLPLGASLPLWMAPFTPSSPSARLRHGSRHPAVNNSGRQGGSSTGGEQ